MDTNHWQQLAEEFKRLRPSIRASRTLNLAGVYPIWTFSVSSRQGGARGTLSTDLEDFRRLATVAARIHDVPSATADDDVEAWLNLLASNHSKCVEDNSPPREVSIFPPWVRNEGIDPVSSASAEYCERLAAKIRIDALGSCAPPLSNDLLRLDGAVAADEITGSREEKLQASSATESGREDRRLEIVAFLSRCEQETPLKPKRKHIWRAAGHTTARQFQFWQGSDPKATTQDDRNFRRILAMSPTDFVTFLRKKGLI